MKQIIWEKFDIFQEEDDLDIESFTDIGIVDLSKVANLNRFNLWICHTNFKLSKRDINTLDSSVDGVESLQLISPYRFIISVGQLFDENKIKKNVEEQLCSLEFAFDQSVLEEIDRLQEQLSKYNLWVIFVMPNGKIDFITDENKNEFTKKTKLYKEFEEKYGGMIFVPETDQVIYNE